MGNLQSSDMDDVGAAPSTPTRLNRILEQQYDPRSPSTDITRTPIQVSSTPQPLLDPRSPSVDITRTPIYTSKPENTDKKPATVSSDPDPLDPRSPSQQISRTPLHLPPTTSTLDPRSPTQGITRTPLHLTQAEEGETTPPVDAALPQPQFDEQVSDGAKEEQEEGVKTPCMPRVLDPRSPSEGIPRTPLLLPLSQEEDQAQETEAEAVETLCEVQATAAQEEEKEEEAVKMREEEEEEDKEKGEAVDADTLAQALAQVNMDTAIPTTPTSPTHNSALRNRRKPKVLFQGNSHRGSTDGSPRSPLRAIDNTLNSSLTDTKPRSPGLKVKDTNSRSPLKVKDANARSPLKVKEVSSRSQKRNVDVNSPRAIMQRKQATKLSSQLSCSLAASQGHRGTRSPARSGSPAKKGQFRIYEDDKENV